MRLTARRPDAEAVAGDSLGALLLRRRRERGLTRRETADELGVCGKALLIFRRQQGVEIRKAAALIGADEGTWRRWERGEWKPTRRTLPSLDGLLGLSVAEVYPRDVR